jgi:thiosulfate dehydrogenase (quinone) large subunit
MKPNPVSDVLHFLLTASWTSAVFWLLVLASIAIAIYAWTTVDGQRTGRHLCNWMFRLLIGSMWWQQTLWKLPPYYTDHPEDPTNTGLYYWMTEMGRSAAIPLQADFVNNIVLPNFHLFAPAVYALEVMTAASLILGFFVRFWGLVGALQILNLWLGLYNSQGEWPWTYFFLFVLQLIFALHQYGRSLGIDAIIVDRSLRRRSRGTMSDLVLGVLT